MISRFERFTYDMNVIDLHWHRIASAEMKRYGLKGGSALYFIKLYKRPEGITAAELTAECGRDKADVSREIAKLEKAGLVSRLATEKSNYRTPIVLTEKGREVTEAIIEKANQAVDLVGSCLTEEEREIFYSALDKITDNIQVLSERGLLDEDSKRR